MPMYQGTAISEPATLSGPAGSAWRVRLVPADQRAKRDHEATVDMFILRRPGAHPFWDHWLVSLVHLRPIVGVKPAHIKVAGATHEFMIMALNPEYPLPTLDAGGNWIVDFLRPIDVVEQFAAVDDVTADQVLELAIRAIVDGLASPDQDWRSWWAQAIATTAQHYLDGTHTIKKS